MLRLIVDKSKNPRTYWPKELVADGFEGEMSIMADNVIAMVIHPSATLDQIKASLELKLKEVKLRIEKERAEPVKAEAPVTS